MCLQVRTNQSLGPSISLILKKISDDKTLVLLNSIAIADVDKYIKLKEMNLSTKQYYSRISGLMSSNATSGLPNEEITQLINALIDNHQIKDILLKSIPSSSTENLHAENNSNNDV